MPVKYVGTVADVCTHCIVDVDVSIPVYSPHHVAELARAEPLVGEDLVGLADILHHAPQTPCIGYHKVISYI